MEESRDKPKPGRSRRRSDDAGQRYLYGNLLIAMPEMNNDVFQRTVIYLCAHNSGGAMGIIVNRPAGSLNFPGLLAQLKIIDKSEQIRLPESAGTMKVLRGGPVDEQRGFVLHSSDFFIKDSTLTIDDHISLTATVDILKAIAHGAGPRQAIFALGYAGWGAGQLESEIQHNGWLHCPADPDLIFDDDIDTKYHRALQKIGIHPGMLSSEAGHA
jgi:putative transcriptional regulator